MSGATPGERLNLLDEIDDGDEGLLGTQILGAVVTKKSKEADRGQDTDPLRPILWGLIHMGTPSRSFSGGADPDIYSSLPTYIFTN